MLGIENLGSTRRVGLGITVGEVDTAAGLWDKKVSWMEKGIPEIYFAIHRSRKSCQKVNQNLEFSLGEEKS